MFKINGFLKIPIIEPIEKNELLLTTICLIHEGIPP